MRISQKLVLTIMLATSSVPAIADDWHVVRLRGTVLHLEDGAWQKLSRGDVVSDDRIIKSLNGRATFQRNDEVVELATNSVIQIMDKSGRDYTTVVGHEGSVSFDVDARNVYHFSVVTPHLAAVVKGTAFSVTAGPATSTLSVTRGVVLVEDTQFGQQMSVTAGEQVEAGGDTPAIPTAVNQSDPPPAIDAPPAANAPQSLEPAPSETVTESLVSNSSSSSVAEVEAPPSGLPLPPQASPPSVNPIQPITIPTPSVTLPGITLPVVTLPVVTLPDLIPPAIPLPIVTLPAPGGCDDEDDEDDCDDD